MSKKENVKKGEKMGKIDSAVKQSQPLKNNTVSKIFINAEEAAAILQLTIKGLYSCVYKRTIPYYKFGKKLMFLQSELENMVLSCRYSTESELKTLCADYLINNKKGV